MKDAGKAAKAARDAHERRVRSYLAQILQIFSALGLDAARVAELVGYDGGGGEAFAFKDYPAARDAVERMFATMRTQMEAVITRSTAAEWARSNEAQDLIADGVLAARKVSRGDGRHEHLYQRNSDQLKAFQARKINGMSLSRRVWELSEGHRAGLEAAISTAVEKGMSAVVLSKKVSQYLDDFPRLRSDYRQRYGRAADIRDCQYESARLARTEINMAYRAAENARWRQMDFVVGMEVKLSGSHPARDICDTLKGRYPKDFEWVGWHPQCICYKVPILSTEDEFFALDDAPSVNTVTDVPEAFKRWCADNAERIAAAEARGTLPYFVRDNREVVRRAMSGGADAHGNEYTQVLTEHGGVWVHERHGKNEVRANVETATYLANRHDYVIDLLPVLPNVKNADAYNRTLGKNQEFKEIMTPTDNAIQFQIRSASKQANSIVLNIKDDVTMEVLRQALTDRVIRCKSIEDVTIILCGKDVTYTRNQIVSSAFQIKRDDFK